MEMKREMREEKKKKNYIAQAAVLFLTARDGTVLYTYPSRKIYILHVSSHRNQYIGCSFLLLFMSSIGSVFFFPS